LIPRVFLPCLFKSTLN